MGFMTLEENRARKGGAACPLVRRDAAVDAVDRDRSRTTAAGDRPRPFTVAFAPDARTR
jgi:hypothetical protein